MSQKLSAQKLSADIQCQILRELSSVSNLDDILAYIAGRVKTTLEASACSIYIVDENGKTATQRAGEGYQQSFVGKAKCLVIPEDQVEEGSPTQEQKLGLTGWILSTGKSFLARTPEELLAHPHRLGTHDPDMLPGQNLRLQTFLGVPMRGQHGDIIGVIKAERRFDPSLDIQPFEAEQQIILETIARMTSKILAYLETARTRNLDAAITAWSRDVISEASITESDMDGFLSIVVNVAAAALRADSCGIYLTDPYKNTLTQRAGIGSQQPRFVIRSYLLPKKEDIVEMPQTRDERVGLTAWIAATGKSFYAKDYKELCQHPHHRGEYDAHNFKLGEQICGAFLGSPLQVAGEVKGTLKVENISIIGKQDDREFSKEARRRFDVLAQDVALAIIRLQERKPYQVIIDSQQTIFEVLHGNQDIQTLVSTVVKKTMELLNARACALFLKEGDKLVQPSWAAAGYAQLSPGKAREYKLVDSEEIAEKPESDKERVGLTVWIAVKRAKFSARSNTELKLHPHHKGTYDPINFDPKKNERCESFMGIPLTVGKASGSLLQSAETNDQKKELIGVLKVESKIKITDDGSEEYTYFSEQDELVFDLIAMSVAIAIKNAKLSESRRFADQILTQPNRLLLDLHDFIKENPQAIETLTQVADLVSSEKQNISTIIKNYIPLVQADISSQSLAAIPDLMHNFGEFFEGGKAMGRLYTEFHKAFKIDSVGQLIDFCSKTPLSTDVEFRQAQFFLAETAAVFIQTIQHLKDALRDITLNRSTLESVRAYLEGIQEQVQNLPTPEQWILSEIVKGWISTIATAKEDFKTVINPYLTGAPVNPKKSPFFGRKDIFEWISENLVGATEKNILVFHGERRMGKTSILLQLKDGELGKPLRENPNTPICPIYIDLQGFNDWETHKFLRRLSEQIANQIIKQYPALKRKISLPDYEHFKELPFGTFEDFISATCNGMQDKFLVLMIDEFELLDKMVLQKELDVKIFSQLRSLMQFQANLTFILAGTQEMDDLSLEYNSLAQNIALIREVSFMDKDDAVKLIREPVSGKVFYEDSAVEEIWHYTHGHPYLLQLLCHDLIYEMNARGVGNHIGVDLVRYIALKFVSMKNTHLNDLWQNNTNDIEKAILYHLAILGEREKHGLTAFEISEALNNFPPEQISTTLSRLIKRGLIEKAQPSEAGASPVLTHTISLFSSWILHNLPPEKQINGSPNQSLGAMI